MTHPPPSQKSMRRIAIASFVGTTVEFYDWFIFATAAALVFGGQFFPALGPAAGTLAALATFGIAFVVRPFGAAFFGHFGDRVGRKKTLVATLLLMGLATFGVGLLPTAATIGVAAPILLIVLRMCQGLAVGGEWAGAVLLTGEHAPKNRRGWYAMFPQLGPALALMLAGGTFFVTSVTLTDEQFVAFGWRIPFLASALLVIVGLYVRLKIDETPAFTNLTATKSTARMPVLDLVRRQPRELLLAAGSMLMIFAFFNMGVTYMVTYGEENLALTRSAVLLITMLSGLFLMGGVFLGARYADRLGRRRITGLAAALAIPWSLLLFPIADLGAVGLGVVICVMQGIVGLGYGPAGAQLPELFHSKHRYTGAGIAYSVSSIVGGAVPPLVAVAMVTAYGSSSLGIYMAVMAVISLACVYALKETRDVEMTDVAAQPTSA